MTDIQIEKMISTGRLILNRKRCLVHYGASILFSVISIVLIITLIMYWPKNATDKDFLIVVLLIFVLIPFLAIATFINQFKALKFQYFKTQFAVTDTRKFVVHAFKQMGWKLKINNKEFVEAYNPRFGYFGRTYGHEMISVVISEEMILINCICSVDTVWFQGALTFGKLRDLLNDFKNNFDMLSKKALDHQDGETISS